jgi:uncharacterized cysteine cluster protein YcgN (CxxCxxCC family)
MEPHHKVEDIEKSKAAFFYPECTNFKAQTFQCQNYSSYSSLWA